MEQSCSVTLVMEFHWLTPRADIEECVKAVHSLWAFKRIKRTDDWFDSTYTLRGNGVLRSERAAKALARRICRTIWDTIDTWATITVCAVWGDNKTTIMQFDKRHYARYMAKVRIVKEIGSL